MKINRTTILATVSCLVLAVPVAAHSQAVISAGYDDEPATPEGYNLLDPESEETGEEPQFEAILPLVPGNDLAGAPTPPDVDREDVLETSSAQAGVSSCTFDNGNGDSGTELVRTYEPFGIAGYTGTDSNNWFKIFYICRTTWSDSNGYRYMFIVTKDRQNSGSNNHVLSTLDNNGVGYYTANHNQWKPVGSGQSMVDIDPDSTRDISSDGKTISFSLGYQGTGLGWSQTMNDGRIKLDYWSGAKVRWHTNTHDWYCCGETGWTSTYGAVQRAKEGTYAVTDWWSEVRFHHYGDADHAHLIGSPCIGVDCGHNRMSNYAGSSSSGGGGDPPGGGSNKCLLGDGFCLNLNIET